MCALTQINPVIVLYLSPPIRLSGKLLRAIILIFVIKRFRFRPLDFLIQVKAASMSTFNFLLAISIKYLSEGETSCQYKHYRGPISKKAASVSGFHVAFIVAWAICLLFYFMQYAVRSAPSVTLPELTQAFG